MFYDERIEKVKGRISRNAIILSVLISMLIGSIRLANVLKNTDNIKYLCFVILEGVIIFGGFIFLLIGFIRSKISFKDERTVSEKSNYYNKASSLLIKIVTIAFSILLSILLFIGSPSNFADIGFYSIIIVMFLIVGIYVIFKFRRNDIYFNYSIMETEHYYKRVFKNIGKLALYIVCLLAVSVILFIFLVVTKELSPGILISSILQIVALYAGVLIELSLIYLLYSFLEKTSYNNKSLISKSTIISLCITVCIYAVYAFIVLFINSLNISNAQATKFVIMASSLATYISFALLIFLTYFIYEYQKDNKNKLLSAACIVIILSETLSVLVSQILDGFVTLFIKEMMEQQNINYILSSAKTIVQDVSSLASVVGLSLILIALIKDNIIKKPNLIAIIVFMVVGGIELFLRTQIGYLQINIYHTLAEIAVLAYFSVVVEFIRRKKINTFANNLS